MNDGILTERDHAALDVFLGQVFDAHAAGTLNREVAVRDLACLITAVNEGDVSSVRMIFRHGVAIGPDTAENYMHPRMRTFLQEVLDDVRDGSLERDGAIGALNHIIGAIDTDNVGEAHNWFKQGRRFTHYGKVSERPSRKN